MSTIFSIGEIAKLFNISTQTLRLYDRIGLLKPSLINEETGYRYYSIDQFIKLECIKRCKVMGFSLDEIKELIGKDTSIEAMLDLTKKQKVSIRQKIEELQLMEEKLNILENKINDTMKIGFNKMSIVENKERIFVKYKENLITEDELEMASREVVMDIEKRYSILEHDISFIISYDDILKDNRVIFKSILVELNSGENFRDKNIVKMPYGKYLTMYFDDSSIDNRKYYNEMIAFINENNIEVEGDFLESAIFLRVNKDGIENTLSKLEIKCRD